jgi:hypothetical protein
MGSKYKNAWEALVGELGKDGARAEMARRRSLVKTVGAANLSKERQHEIMAHARSKRRVEQNEKKDVE